ncbi:ABC transporter substrate-binding protein [Castellaniella sp.]|uniref:ABC transporter substrate-binding protein n=1 Tax=Castellaniella sp. TaxID=1955812 RepID=UPI00355DB755
MPSKGVKLFITATALALGGISTSVLAEGVLKIGITAPLTGSAAQSGLATVQGVQIQADKINQAGGVDVGGQKYKLELVVEDTENNPAQGVSVVQKLITNDKVDFLIADVFASSVTMAEMELADQFKTPMLSCQPVSSDISAKVQKNPEKYQYFWKGNFSSDAYAEGAYESHKMLVANGDLSDGNKKIALIAEDTDYGRSIAKLTGDLFKGDGWEIVANETVPLGHTNFNAILSKIDYMEPDVLFSVFTSADSGIALSRQFVETGLTAFQYAIYYPLRPEYLQGAKQAGEGMVWSPLSFDLGFPGAKELNDLVQEKFKVSATGDHANGFDCMGVIAQAYELAGTTDKAAVAAAMGRTDFDGVMGKHVFNLDNHTAKAGPDFIRVPTVQIQNGVNKVLWPENIANTKYQKQSWMK